MLLRQYLDDRQLTYAAFAALIGVSTQAIHRYAVGDRVPRREVMRKISCVTKGLVQPNDFFPSAKEAA